MNAPGTPIRWPRRWNQPSSLAHIQGAPIDCLLVEKGADLGAVVAQARQNGITVIENDAPPAEIRLIKGEWPGVAPRSGADASAGPTGNPWVDSNGWKVRLEAALHPGASIWVDAPPKGSRVSAEGYVLAIADAAAHGGRWIISLDEAFADRVASGETAGKASWKRLLDAAAFFADHKAWNESTAAASIGVVSDFVGENEFMGQELLNLITRTNQQYRIIMKGSANAASYSQLKALLYADAQPPSASLRTGILSFVEAGGILITGPNWGPAPGAPARTADEHPRYAWRASGKGRIAISKAPFDDPYVVANDAVLLTSHRHELLRFWNGGSVGSYYTLSRDAKRAVVHLLFYANRGPAAPTVRVAGKFRSGKLWTLDRRESRPIEMEIQSDAVELHLPQMSQYAAAELEV